MVSRSTVRSTLEVCADCNAPDPKWASVNRGVLVCDECCSVHRSLGRHISQIRSLKKGVWPPSLLAMVHQLSNSGANNIWEHSMLDPNLNRSGRRKPNPRDNLHPTKSDFIRAKYQLLAYTKKYTDEDLGSVQDLSKQLHSSVRTGNLETSLRLLSLGADPNYYNTDRGTSALHVAAQSGQILQVELLIVYGADPGQPDGRDRAPYEYAREEGHHNICHRLIESQYELTDRLTLFLCSKIPDHKHGHHFLIPEMGDCSIDYSELAKAAKQKLQALPNHLFEELAMDVHDEVERRENENIWRSTQSPTTLNTRLSLAHLPVNSEFSTTRNQGRQKLARFNKRELCTLIIDVLTDTKRRQLGGAAGSVSGPPPGFSPLIGAGPNMRRLHASSFSDDEPAYDSVASDEDYSSVGDRHSLKDQSISELPLEEEVLTDGGTDVLAKANGSTDPLSPTGTTTTATITRVTSPVTPSLSQSSSNRTFVSGGSGEEGGGVSSSMVSDVTLSSNEMGGSGSSEKVVSAGRYRELEAALVASESKYMAVSEKNKGLEREMSLMQRTVQRLISENAEMKRSSQLALSQPPSPNVSHYPHALSALSNGRLVPTGVAAPHPSAQCSVHPSLGGGELGGRPNSYGRSRPVSMFEPRRVPAASVKPVNEPVRRLSGTHSVSCNNLGPDKKTASGSVIDSDNDSSSLYDNEPVPSQTAGEAQELPMQEDLNSFTETVTRRIQELYQSAKSKQTQSFYPCAKRINDAITDMISMFPEDINSEKVRTHVTVLTLSTTRLLEHATPPPGPTSPPMSGAEGGASTAQARAQAEQVIQCAFDIAKSLKALVMSLGRRQVVA